MPGVMNSDTVVVGGVLLTFIPIQVKTVKRR